MKNNSVKGRLMKIILTIIIIIILIFIYFNIPYSPVLNDYKRLVNNISNDVAKVNGSITLDDLENIPVQLQKYILNNGYLNTNKVSHIKFYCKGVDFLLDKDKPKIKIDFTVNLFADNIKRFALIDSKMYGVPFQGLDVYENQKGFMKGVIAKNITLFNEIGNHMDRGELTTYIAEGMLFPSIFLSDKFLFEEIDEYSINVTVKDGNLIEIGTVFFNEKYEIIKLTIDKRYNTSTESFEKWSCLYGSYKQFNGVKRPTNLKAIWNFKSSDSVYFDTDNIFYN